MEQLKKDREILRSLATKIAEIAEEPIQSESKKLWAKLNKLEDVRPMVWINEIPWNEIDVNNELVLQTKGDLNRYVEREMRRTIYQWEHMRADMVVESYIECPLDIYETGIGIKEKIHKLDYDLENDVKGIAFEPVLFTEDDIEKIQNPKVIYDREKNENNLNYLKDIFDGILEVRMSAPFRHHFRLALIDEYIRYRGIEQMMVDLLLEPEFVHKALKRLYQGMISRIQQFEELNLLKLNNGNYRIGSGGLGYTDELPKPDFKPEMVRTIDMWGSAQDQIFSEVSPKMHEEFTMPYVAEWMKKFGLTYYGCCEPLHKKVDMLRKIPNLRKISMSPWVKEDEGVANIGKDYIYSYKPSPAAFIQWSPGKVGNDLETFLKKARNNGCIVEIIMKDISTVQYKPQHLWEWAKIAVEIAKRY